MVRIMRQGKKYQKNFSKKKYGGWGAAAKEARKWRDEMLEKLPERQMNAEGRSANNTSGVVGVHLCRSAINRPSGRSYEYWRWIAKWPGCRYKGGLGWSINAHGEDDAFVLAVLSREMRTVDRRLVIEKLEKIKKLKRYEKIKAMRQLVLS